MRPGVSTDRTRRPSRPRTRCSSSSFPAAPGGILKMLSLGTVDRGVASRTCNPFAWLEMFLLDEPVRCGTRSTCCMLGSVSRRMTY